MVRGLELFQQHFAPYAGQYILIGGTAATLAMSGAGLEFRATKDLDIVLHVEALTPDFGQAFWNFVEAGGYDQRQAGDKKGDKHKAVFYRFQTPADNRYPAMLELFSRAPGGIELPQGSHLTPIPLSDSVASLSAILLDDDYYHFILEGSRNNDGMRWVGEDRLIPLKASAWLDLRERKANGASIDRKDIRKHANDALRLSQLLEPQARIPLAGKIARDLARFVEGIKADDSIDPKALGLRASLGDVLKRIVQAYGLGETPAN